MFSPGKLRVVLIWLVCGCLAAPAQAVAPRVPLDDYWRQLHELRIQVANSIGEPPGTVSARLRAEAETWAAITSVALPTGEIVPVDSSFLVAQLRAEPPDLKRLQGMLSALETAQQDWLASQHGAADLKPLADILARPEFQWQPVQPTWLDLLWGRIWEAFGRLLAWLLPDSVVISLNEGLLSYLITAVAAVIMVVVLTYMLRGLALDFAAETEVADKAPHDEILTADAALRRAQALSRAGDYRTAVRYLYLSALLVLDERGLLRYDRSLTNREYLKTVAHLPDVAAILGEVVEVFDRVWYGYQPLDAAGFNQYAARVAELQQRR